MSDQDNLFPESKDTPPADNSVDTLLDMVKREDGSRKYATLEELVKGTINANEHIKTLTQKLDSLSEGKEKAALERILEKLETPAVTPPVTPQETKGLSKEDVAQMIEQLEQERKAKENVQVIKSTLIKQAGSEEAAAKLFKERAESIGLTPAELTSLASRSPVAVQKLLGISTEGAPQKSSSSINSGVIPPAEEKVPRVMLGGGSTEDLLKAWRKHAAKTN